MVKQAFIFYIAAVLISAGGAQESSATVLPLSGWRVYYAEGGITLYRGGVRSVYQGESKELGEILLGPRDIVQTGNGNAELQMISGTSFGGGTHTVIRLSENATLRIDDKPEDGDFTVELLYGRMRVITGTAEPSIVIRTGSSFAALKDSDTAIDYVARPGIAHPILSVHCFSGQGELIPRSMPGTETAKLPLKADESIFMEYQTPFSYVERKNLDTQVVEYWNLFPFSGEAPLAMPLMEKAAALMAEEPELAQQTAQAQAQEQQTALAQQAAEQQPATEEESTPAKKEKAPRQARVSDGSRAKHIFAITGIILAAAGTAAQTYSLIGNPSPALKAPLFYGSYAPLGVGVLFILGSSIFYPGKTAPDK